jgi:predicted AAA+ superfamily ATPase
LAIQVDDMENLRYILSEWFENPLPAFIKRNVPTDILEEGFILSLAGVRRGGKTYTFYQIIDNLLQTVPKQNIIYINFEDDRLLPITGNEISEILNIYHQHYQYNDKFPIYLFLDEVQNIPNWDKSVRRILDHEKHVKIAITGSNSKLLSSEISTALRGRTLSSIIFPLSFPEFLRFKQIEIQYTENIAFSPQKNQILRLFNEYKEYGSFPQVVLSQKKNQILTEYFRAIFYRDIIERYQIRQIKVFENFLKLVIQSMASRFSFGKIANAMASLGQKVSKTTLIDYMSQVEAAFLAFQIPIWSNNVKDQLQYPRKIFLIDTGLRNAISFRFSDDHGRLLENIVFNQLHRRRENEIYYYANEQGQEVDFVVKQGIAVTNLIQVCENLADPETRKREIRSLVKAMHEFQMDSATILTHDEHGTESIQDKTITLKPVWLWLLEQD